MATVLREVEAVPDAGGGSRKIAELPTRKVRMTDKWVEKVSTPPSTRATYRDEIVTAMYLRVSDKGAKGWSVAYHVAGAGDGRKRGKMQRMTLGGYPLVGLEKARQKARDALEAAAKGVDAAVQRVAELEARQTRTFEVIFERFVDLHVKQNAKEGRFARERATAIEAARAGKAAVPPKGPTGKIGRVAAERIIADHALPVWRGRLIETITRAEVHDLLDDIVSAKGEALARELRKHLTKAFNWADERGHIAASPLAGMRRPELGYVPRERDLSMEELRRVWDAAGELGYPFGPMYRLLILTGQRRSEIAELERGWVDAQHRAVEIPASRYKTKQPHVYPLSASAWAFIQSLPKWNVGECMFTTTSGARPVSGFSKAKAAGCEDHRTRRGEGPTAAGGLDGPRHSPLGRYPDGAARRPAGAHRTRPRPRRAGRRWNLQPLQLPRREAHRA
ncbi:integrase [Sphingomonas faeni]|nr:integrase family protein [Sphingomonas faeni]MDQ0839516.1 integrase [Sphingomonas faeni]